MNSFPTEPVIPPQESCFYTLACFLVVFCITYAWRSLNEVLLQEGKGYFFVILQQDEKESPFSKVVLLFLATWSCCQSLSFSTQVQYKPRFQVTCRGFFFFFNDISSQLTRKISMQQLHIPLIFYAEHSESQDQNNLHFFRVKRTSKCL